MEYNPSGESNPLGYNPPRFFWALKLRSGEEIWQYNPVSGEEVILKDLISKDPSILKNCLVVALLPFGKEMVEVVKKGCGTVCLPPDIPTCLRITLEEGWRPIFYRSQGIRMGPNGQERFTFYHVGYQYLVKGTNVKFLITVDDAGFVEVNHFSARGSTPKVFEVERDVDSK